MMYMLNKRYPKMFIISLIIVEKYIEIDRSVKPNDSITPIDHNFHLLAGNMINPHAYIYWILFQYIMAHLVYANNCLTCTNIPGAQGTIRACRCKSINSVVVFAFMTGIFNLMTRKMRKFCVNNKHLCY